MDCRCLRDAAGFADVIHASGAARDRPNVDRLIQYVPRFDAVTAKRLGRVLDTTGTGRFRLAILECAEGTGYRRLYPNGLPRGPFDRM